MKILMITENDPAGMGIAFCNAINRYSDHSCRLVTTQERYGLGFEADIHIPEIENDDFGEVEFLLKDSDLIHFHMLKDEHSHLGPLVIRDYVKGKPVVHHHHGHPDFLINAGVYNEKYRRLGRKVLVSTPDLLNVAENSVWIPNIVPVNDVQFMPRYEDNLPDDRIRICQSPTRKFHKHTKEFKTVMGDLERIYGNLETLVIEKIPYFKCLNIKRTCHIVFDHMRGWFGIASLESLCHGKPVIAGLDDFNQECIREFTGWEKLPWHVARNEDELRKTLVRLIEDRDLRLSSGKESRTFMEEAWNERRVLRLLFDFYNTI
jgi:glycosyltransferase involved in cell wall biosynthesis